MRGRLTGLRMCVYIRSNLVINNEMEMLKQIVLFFLHCIALLHVHGSFEKSSKNQ